MNHPIMLAMSTSQHRITEHPQICGLGHLMSDVSEQLEGGNGDRSKLRLHAGQHSQQRGVAITPGEGVSHNIEAPQSVLHLEIIPN